MAYQCQLQFQAAKLAIKPLYAHTQGWSDPGLAHPQTIPAYGWGR